MWPCSHPTKEKPRSRIFLSLYLLWLCVRPQSWQDNRKNIFQIKHLVILQCFIPVKSTGGWLSLVILQCFIPVKSTGSRLRLSCPDSVVLSGCSIPHYAIQRKGDTSPTRTLRAKWVFYTSLGYPEKELKLLWLCCAKWVFYTSQGYPELTGKQTASPLSGLCCAKWAFYTPLGYPEKG